MLRTVGFNKALGRCGSPSQAAYGEDLPEGSMMWRLLQEDRPPQTRETATDASAFTLSRHGCCGTNVLYRNGHALFAARKEQTAMEKARRSRSCVVADGHHGVSRRLYVSDSHNLPHESRLGWPSGAWTRFAGSCGSEGRPSCPQQRRRGGKNRTPVDRHRQKKAPRGGRRVQVEAGSVLPSAERLVLRWQASLLPVVESGRRERSSS